MRCPRCGHPKTRVLETRSIREGYTARRRRRCRKCGLKTFTIEQPEELLSLLVAAAKDMLGKGRKNGDAHGH